MDLQTGKTYETLEAARAAGVPESDIALIVGRAKATLAELSDAPEVRFASGPFRDRVYKRHPQTNQLVRIG